MTESRLTDKPEPVNKTKWKRVYLLVLAFFVLFCLFMYLFTKYTA
jgi:hypothetical protein